MLVVAQTPVVESSGDAAGGNPQIFYYRIIFQVKFLRSAVPRMRAINTNMFEGFTDTTSHPIWALSRKVTSTIAIKTDGICALLGEMIRSVTFTASLGLIVVLHADLKASEPEETWNIILQTHA